MDYRRPKHRGRLAGDTMGQGRGIRYAAKQAERLAATRLRYTINTHLEDRGITTPASVCAVTDQPAAEVIRLLTRRQWHEGGVAALKAIADRLGIDVQLKGPGLLRQEGRGP
jgi:hypothetical protein